MDTVSWILKRIYVLDHIRLSASIILNVYELYYILFGNFSPPMGARNQVCIVLSYWTASLCSLATQFQTRFLGSIPRPIASHCKDKIPRFRNKEYRGLSPNFHIHVSVRDLYIATIGVPILLEEICRPILGLYKSLTDTWMLKLRLRPRYSQKRNI